MEQSMLKDFRQFTSLPAELRRKIWEETNPRPSIQVFDVCVPSSFGYSRVRRAFEARDGTIRNEKQYQKYKDTVFLDVAEITPEPSQNSTSNDIHEPATQGLSHDPSMYRAIEKIRSTCSEANASLQLYPRNSTILGNDTEPTLTNSVYLPGRDKWVKYDNTSDVLLLRFGVSGSIQNIAQQRLLGDIESPPVFSNGISDVPEGMWSSEIASTLWDARKIALDVADTWAANESTPIMYEEVAYLSCCLQKDLKVLYLIDTYPEENRRWKMDQLSSEDLRQEFTLMSQLDSSIKQRKPGVIHGVGVEYHEIYDLEMLGWSENHPTFVLAQMFKEMIRSQQGEEGPFQGVRILVSVPEKELEVSFQSMCISN